MIIYFFEINIVDLNLFTFIEKVKYLSGFLKFFKEKTEFLFRENLDVIDKILKLFLVFSLNENKKLCK